MMQAAVPGSVQTQENIRRLQTAGSVVVLVELCPVLLGGPAFQILRCLTAIRACEELAGLGIPAVPVCWISETAAPSLPMDSVYLLDAESEIRCVQLRKPGAAAVHAGNLLHADQVSELFEQIEDLEKGTFDAETREIIRASYIPGATLSSACAHLLSALMKEWGLVVLDSMTPAVQSVLNRAAATSRGRSEDGLSSLLQRTGVPVVAYVVSPYGMQTQPRARPVSEAACFPQPIVWPQSSATVLDARSRRILERYRLTVDQLFSGEEAVARRIREAMPRSAFGKLGRLKAEVETQMTEAVALNPGGSALAKTVDACKQKILYQLQKLQEQCTAAEKRKEQVMNRQLRSVCNSLAPNRRTQEREIGGIQIPLRYSRSGLQFLCKELDIREFEHQLISMD